MNGSEPMAVQTKTNDKQAHPVTELVGKRCQYLGMDQDPDTAMSFAAPWHHCYHVDPSTPIKLDHQQVYCLTDQHTVCPLYQSRTKTKIAPKRKSLLDYRPDLGYGQTIVRQGLHNLSQAVINLFGTLGGFLRETAVSLRSIFQRVITYGGGFYRQDYVRSLMLLALAVVLLLAGTAVLLRTPRDANN